MIHRTLYEILGVDTTATSDQIKAAYRRQAMKWHPDRNPNDRAEAEARFKEIGYAYKVLSDSENRAAYDAELASSPEPPTNENPDTDTGPEQAFSQQDASAVFFEQMLDLAIELASRGYGDALIARALIGLDCPELVAKQVAALATKNKRATSDPNETNANRSSRGSRVNGSDDIREKEGQGTATTNRHQSATAKAVTSDWNSIETYFSAALVGPGFVPSDSDTAMGIGAVRIGVAEVLSGLFAAFFLQYVPNEFGSALAAATFAIFLGWVSMYAIFQFSAVHRRYVAAERLEGYLPIFREMVASKKYVKNASGSLLFPVPWFGYYGLYWPLVSVTALFVSAELIVLLNVGNNILAQEKLLSIWEFLEQPVLHIVFFFILAYAFPYLLFVRIKSVLQKLKSQGQSAESIKREMFSRCGPKLWRAVLATTVFFGCLQIPEFAFKQQKDRIEVALAAKRMSPEQAFSNGIAILREDSGDVGNAFLFLLASAEKNHAKAEKVLGYLFASGDRVARDPSVAHYWLDRATSHGNAEAPMLLGHLLFSGQNGFQIDQISGLAYLKIAADRGDPPSQVSVGWSYMLGLGGLTTDFSKAAYWNREGAKGGSREGYNNLGWQYEHGLGVSRDYAQAATLYKTASDMGSKEAADRLAKLDRRQNNAMTLGYPKESIYELQIELIADGFAWTYAEFDPRSTNYNSEITKKTLELQNAKVRQGIDPVSALELAAIQVVRDAGLKRRQ